MLRTLSQKETTGDYKLPMVQTFKYNYSILDENEFQIQWRPVLVTGFLKPAPQKLTNVELS